MRVVIIGAGMSGIAMAVRLQAAGIDDVQILEKGDDVGGTWRDNTYPGLTCDVPSSFYTYTFAPNPNWSAQFPSGVEIHRYLRDVARAHGLDAITRFGVEVTEGAWADGTWTLRTATGEEVRADVVVVATGVLHRPRVPAIPGLEDFEGPVFHSARWDHSVDVRHTRLGVVGTGSTGVQIVGALAGVAPHVTHFARTPQWIVPMPNWHYSRWGRALRRRVPALTRLSYRYNQRTMDSFFGGLLVPGRRRAITQWACRANLKRVRDPELRAKLTPDYQAGCKRLVVSWDYYPAIQRPDVELVTEKIERVEARGIRTADGRLHELDAIALATGFDAQAYVRPMRLTGLDGHTLDEAWTRAPAAHLTVSVPNFPNFFLLMGPNSPIGNTSLVPIAEAQADLVARFVERMARGELRTVAARAEAAEAFRRALAERMPDTVWVTGCSSWYLADDGVPTLWPYTPREFYERLAAAPDEDFVLTGAAES